MLMHTCCCIFIYVVSGFDRIQKGVQNLLKMNLQNYFIKEKGKSFICPLFLGFWLAGPTSPPPLLAFRRPKWALPILSLGVAKTACPLPLCSPSSGLRALIAFLSQPSNERSRALVPARSVADARPPATSFC
jgi:hypothetical protein